MTTNVDALILDRFLTAYGSPNTEDMEGFFAEYRKALGGVRRDILQKVSDRVVWNHTYPTWPTVGRCLEVLRATNRDFGQREPDEPADKWGTRRTPTQAEKDRVAEMVEAFKARMAQLEDDYVQHLPPLPRVDRNAWNERQSSLLASGKWCLTWFLARRTA